MPVSSAPPPSWPTQRAMPAAGVPVQRRGLLVVTAGELVGRVISFPSQPQMTTLGRAPECAVSFQSLSVSRVHARLARFGHEHFIADAGSTNGTFINGNRIHGGTPLQHGDQVRLGTDVTLRFALVDPDEETGLLLAGEASGRDPLTGAFTRAHLERALDVEIQRAIRKDLPLCGMMIDVDRFKVVNDTYGHLAGDEVLAGLGRVMRDCVRNTDVLARFGGEEFVVVAPDTPLEKAHSLAERIRRAVGDAHFVWGSRTVRVTISIGIASLACCGAEPDRLKLLWLADQRVYLAKRTRDAVMSSGGNPARFSPLRSRDATRPGSGRS